MSMALQAVEFGSGFSFLVILEQSAHLAAKYLQFHSDWTSSNSLDSRKGNWFLGLLTTWSRKVRSFLRTQPHLKQLVLGFDCLMLAWSLKGSEKRQSCWAARTARHQRNCPITCAAHLSGRKSLLNQLTEQNRADINALHPSNLAESSKETVKMRS